MSDIEDNIDDNTSSSSNDEPKCSICFESFDGTEKQLQCSHKFHKRCIDDWTKENPTCPICRYYIEGIKKETDNQTDFINSNYLQQSLLGYHTPNIQRNNSEIGQIKKFMTAILPLFCVLLFALVIIFAIKTAENNCYLVDCIGLDKNLVIIVRSNI